MTSEAAVNPKGPLDPGLLAWVRDLRHEFHAHPELSGAEKETGARVRRELLALGFAPESIGEGEGLIATFPGRDPSRCIALRADMDALPLQEQSDQAHASRHAGVMHACGHDGHTSILLGVARALVRGGKPYRYPVRLLFQPAEESGQGAKTMVEAGALDSPPCIAVFGLHGWPTLPLGTASVRTGAMMGSVDNFDLLLHGKGGHGAQPHLTRDPLPAAAALIGAAQALIARETDPLSPAVLTFGHIAAGHTYNVIPDRAALKGTLRTQDNALRARLKGRFEELVRGIAAGTGVTPELRWVEACPATVNPAPMAELVRRAVTAELGEAGFREEASSMAGEDFSYFLEKAPGAYFWLGLGDARGGLHNPRFDFNDEALGIGIRLFLRILKEWE